MIVILSYDNWTVNGGTIAAIAVIAVAVIGVMILLNRAGIALRYHGGTEEFCQLYDIPQTVDAERLVDRYLARSARFRSGWMWLGIALAVVLGVGNGSLGVAGYPPTSNLFLMGLGAWFVGLVRCETYNLRFRSAGQRAASLEPRSIKRYAPPRLRIHNFFGALVAWVVVAVDLLLPSARQHIALIVAFALLCLVVVGVSERCQHAIALRARPALGDDLLAADDAIRSVAARSVAYGAAGLESLLIGSQCLMITQGRASGVAGTPRTVFALVELGLCVWAAVLAMTARRELQPWFRTGRQQMFRVGSPS